MVDLRYLALTLIGVFLALAVGLILGSTLGTPDRRDRVYEGLQGQFEQLRTQNQQVQDENDRVRKQLRGRDQAIRELLPVAVHNRLPGSTVGVVICGPLDVRPFWGDLESALRSAGGRIGPVLRVPDRLRELDAASRARLGPRSPAPAADRQPEPYEAAGWCVEALARGSERERLQELTRRTGIELRGDTTLPIRRLLLLGAAPEERTSALAAGEIPEFQVVEAARQEGVRVVAAEPEAGAASVVDALRRRNNIPTVDDVDTPAGQLSVVLALAGADGHFGTKAGAAAAIPALDSP